MGQRKAKRAAAKIAKLMHKLNVGVEDGLTAMLMLSAASIAALNADKEQWMEWFRKAVEDAETVRELLDKRKKPRLRVVK